MCSVEMVQHMTDSIQFVLGREFREISDVNPTTTVLNYLRREERQCGTKEGCAEGDCGACTVVVGEVQEGGEMQYRAVNSCIMFVTELHGKHVLAVEDIQAGSEQLHPAQRAIAESNGSQCGYCTPGFVMSLYAMYENGIKTSKDNIDDTLAGNLCRCTGYGTIIKAAETMGALPKPANSALADRPVVEWLKQVKESQALYYRFGKNEFFAPGSVDELASAIEKNPNAKILAGGTDLGLWVTKLQRELPNIISINQVAELRQIKITDQSIEFGSAAKYSDLHGFLYDYFPDFGEVVRRLGAVQIRNQGTVGGNIANGSPIGDTPPALIALNAKIVLRKGSLRREISLEDYYVSYGKQDRKPGEFLEKIIIPLEENKHRRFAMYKISKRFDEDISLVSAAFSLKLDGDQVKDIRICYGGMAGIPQRATQVEGILNGQLWNESNVRRAAEAIDKEFKPLTDVRGSKEYRSQVAKNLVVKFYIETVESNTRTRILSERRPSYV